MDVGESLNPAIDIGQIEGGFIQVSSQWQGEHMERRQCLLPNYNIYFPKMTNYNEHNISTT